MLINGEGAPPRGPVSIVVSGDRIDSISNSAPDIAGAEIINGNGMYALPGFIDAHTHIGTPGQGLTGPITQGKTYYRHTGYPGGIKETTPEKVLEGKFPERVLELAVKRMLPRGPLGRQQLSNLRVYAGTAHPHDAQSPETLDVAAMNAKNVRG